MTDEGTVPHRVDVDGVSIEFSDRGAGEPVLVVHAGVFTDWFPLVAADPSMSGFRLVMPVRAGYDSSRPAPGRHLTLADHARHCAAALDNLGITQAHVMAHSSGSLIGLELAVERPDLVRGLVLVEPPLAPSLLPPEAAEGISGAINGMRAMAAAGDLKSAFDTFMRVVCAEDYREVLLAALGPDGPERAERDCGFFFADEIVAVLEWALDDAHLGRITHPVLFVAGGASPPLEHGVIATLAGSLPNAATATVAGSDHMLPLRHPAVLAELTADFLNRNRL